MLLLWFRLAATTLVRPLGQEVPYAKDAALKRQKKKKKKKKKKRNRNQVILRI